MAEISAKASFDGVRYAQAWEDADVLCRALSPKAGGDFLSVCAAGDNVLALLTLDPKRVVAVDLSRAQISCLRLRMAAMRRLGHHGFLELLGVVPSTEIDRGGLLTAAIAGLEPDDAAFWEGLREAVVAHGAAHVGKFERYFRLFRRYVLPLVASRDSVDELLTPHDEAGRLKVYDQRWDTWRWRLLLRLFFSRTAMGLLGRDPSFFEHAVGSLPRHVAERARHAGVRLDPSANPYLRQILTGFAGPTLPVAWRRENYELVASRLDRIEVVHGDVVGALAGQSFDAFNLSDVFEYMSEAEFVATYRRLLQAAGPGALLAYWNMMAPRSRPACFIGQARRLDAQSEAAWLEDKAFFYSAFHIDEVRLWSR